MIYGLSLTANSASRGLRIDQLPRSPKTYHQEPSARCHLTFFGFEAKKHNFALPQLTDHTLHLSHDLGMRSSR